MQEGRTQEIRCLIPIEENVLFSAILLQALIFQNRIFREKKLGRGNVDRKPNRHQ